MKRWPAWNLVIILLLSFVFGSRPILHGYSVSMTGYGGIGEEIKWATPFMAYRINLQDAPAGAEGAILAAASEWNKVENSRFAFVYQGRSTKRAAAGMDEVNVIAFEYITDPLYLEMVCYNSIFYDVFTGELIESDINFNLNNPISTDETNSAYDLQNIATHEFGHSLSLEDLCPATDPCGPDDPQLQFTMYNKLDFDETKKRTLAEDDIAGIQYLYSGLGVKVERFLIDNGAEKVTRRLVTLRNLALGNPTQYQISEYSDFRDARWRPYASKSQFLLTAGAGIKKVHLRLRNGLEEPTTISCTIEHLPGSATPSRFLLQD